MIHPSDARDPSIAPIAVRDGQGAPVTCDACGCRLQASATGTVWFHFNPLAGRDARGCRVVCADVAHDATGKAVRLTA